MPIPFHSHVIDVLDQDPADADAEPYSGDTAANRIATSTNVRAVISGPRSGAEAVAGGEQSTVYHKFTCDEVPLDHRSWIRDTVTGDVYTVVWAAHRTVLGFSYVQGQLRKVEGLP